MKRDSRRVCVFLMILCHFILIIGGVQGGILSLNKYIISVKGTSKTLVLVGLVHEGDLKADTCELVAGFAPTKCLYDLHAHAKIMEKVLFDKLRGDEKSRIPVILEEDEIAIGPYRFVEQQILSNRKLCSDPSLAKRAPLLCADERNVNDLLFLKWLEGTLPSSVMIVPDPKEFMKAVDIKEYEKAVPKEFDLKVHPIPGGGVYVKCFSPYLHVKENLNRYKQTVSTFESYVKGFGCGDILVPALSEEKTRLDAFPKSTIQTNILAVNNGFLKFLKGWLDIGSLTELSRRYGFKEVQIKNSLSSGMAEPLANMSFFSVCASHLLQPDVQTVVACVGTGHALAIGKMIQESGGQLLAPSLGTTDIGRDSYTFLTPFQLRMFLSMTLGVAVDRGDIIIFDEMNSSKLADAPRCNWCRKKQSQGLLKCARCKEVSYCGSECQRSDWYEGHKAQCRSLKSRKEVEKKEKDTGSKK